MIFQPLNLQKSTYLEVLYYNSNMRNERKIFLLIFVNKVY